MERSISITRRLTLAILLLEAVSATTLIGAIAFHERHIQLRALDANIQGTADALMASVQDAEAALDIRGARVSKDAVYRVEDEQGRVLGVGGDVPKPEVWPSGNGVAFRNSDLHGRTYRFVILRGGRGVTIVYGRPVGHVWHEVFEAIGALAVGTGILLVLTAVAMIWQLKRSLWPLQELAQEAQRITSESWKFNCPALAKETEELRPLALALEGTLARLQRSFEQQRRFTSDAAHELKTDLAIVKSSLQLLLMRRRTADEYRGGLISSLDDFSRPELTVQRMLTLARVEQPEGEDAERPFCSLRGVVEETVHRLTPFADTRQVNVSLQTMTDAILPIDRHDALLLCSNVLLNALQHTPVRSSVQIEATFRDDKVSLTVRDEGEGITDKDRPHLFEPFYRGDPSRSRKSGGAGLGLSICKAICQRVGGAIEITNIPAGGALVAITLPAQQVAEKTPP
jgi:signal transduction histidine kinase